MSLITVIGRGHSGTRAMSHTLSASGVDMGNPLNNSGDLIPAEDMYEACRVFAQYVDWQGDLGWDWRRAAQADPPEPFTRLISSFLKTVLASNAQHKGWKIPETTLCFPWISRLFPDAKYIFWIRNPRDCIIGKHVTDDLERFGIPYPTTLDERRRRAISWKYQYDLVKATPKPKNWIEVRLEDFVLKQDETLARLEQFLGFPLAKIPVKPEVIDRWLMDDDDASTGPNYYSFFEPAMREYGYGIPQNPKSIVPPPFTFNTDEAKVPAGTLPEVLTANDGSKVTQAEQWPARRAEILNLFATEMYGQMPGRPPRLNATIREQGACLNGKAIRQQVRLNFTDDQDKFFLDLLILKPTADAQPAPAFLGLNFHGNHTVLDDTAILLPESPVRDREKFGGKHGKPSATGRGKAAETWSAELLMEHGYALVTAYCGDLDPDFHDCFRNGVHPLFPSPGYAYRSPHAWGTIGAWAWGLCRAMDYLETRTDILDPKRIAVIGHSRLGKTALWAAANDERFAMTVAVQSGCCGAALSKRCFGENIASITAAFPHWFCSQFRKYANAEQNLPFDQHMLIASLAPRPAYIASASEDLWADPKGEFLAARYAQPAYDLFGLTGIGQDEPPPPDTTVGDTVAYHRRTGIHQVTAQDWKAFLSFADKHLR
ncbi:MAG: sulfotransferase [Lentisphaeria bacterium]|nr:sulfotransferase [Lentisphaeria bacterium]